MNPEELKKIAERIDEEDIEFSSRKEQQIFLDLFEASRDDGDTIEESIDYALDQYKGESE